MTTSNRVITFTAGLAVAFFVWIIYISFRSSPQNKIQQNTPLQRLEYFKAEQNHFLGSTECSTFTKVEKDKLENGCENQADPRLLELLRCAWIYPPSQGPVRLMNPEKTHFSQFGQSQLLDDLMEGKQNGFYVECGAADGEFLSNSLFFERNRSWSGLLIEPNPKEFTMLMKKGRKAFTINACLTTDNKTGKILFDPKRLLGGLVREMVPAHEKYMKSKEKKIDVQCFTLYSIMKALGRSHIDLLSLDVEGAEVGILGTIPFSELTIDILLIEYTVLGSNAAGAERFKNISNIMRKTGLYEFVGTNAKLDMLFVAKTYITSEKLKRWKGKMD